MTAQMAAGTGEREPDGRDVTARRRYHRPMVTQTDLAKALAERDPEGVGWATWLRRVLEVERGTLRLPEAADYRRWVEIVDEIAEARKG